MLSAGFEGEKRRVKKDIERLTLCWQRCCRGDGDEELMNEELFRGSGGVVKVEMAQGK